MILDIAEEYYRPSEVDVLIGDSSKAKKELGWEAKINLSSLIEMMAKYDLDTIKK